MPGLAEPVPETSEPAVVDLGALVMQIVVIGSDKAQCAEESIHGRHFGI